MPDVTGTLKPPRLATAPASPTLGQMYYNTTNNILYWWNGTTWNPSELEYFEQPNAPSGTVDPGAIWVDTDDVSPPGAAGIPPGGAIGTILTKTGSTDYTAGWQPPAPSGSQITYKGDWVAGSYNDGDVIVYNGVEYMAVRATSNTPVPWPVQPFTPQSTTYGTSLPTSPGDGMEAILVDSTTNPTYTWRFRYNAGSTSAYKWEFIGGAPKVIIPNAYTVGGAGGWYTDTAAASTINVPRAGDYFVQASTNIAGGSPVGPCYMGFPQVVPRAGQSFTGNGESSIFFMTVLPALTVGAAIQNQFFASATPNALFNNREMSVQPQRVA